MLLKTDNLGIPRFTNKDLMEVIYTGHIDKCHAVLCDPTDDVDKFNEMMEEQGLPLLSKYVPIDVDQKTFDKVCQSEWFMPEKYKSMNLLMYFSKFDLSKEQKDRVFEELTAYKDRDMFQLLKYMIYLVDFMRENNIVWGVGRGSSVSSYVLYLIGIHKVDSIKYNLNWQEFLK